MGRFWLITSVVVGILFLAGQASSAPITVTLNATISGSTSSQVSNGTYDINLNLDDADVGRLGVPFSSWISPGDIDFGSVVVPIDQITYTFASGTISALTNNRSGGIQLTNPSGCGDPTTYVGIFDCVVQNGSAVAQPVFIPGDGRVTVSINPVNAVITVIPEPQTGILLGLGLLGLGVRRYDS